MKYLIYIVYILAAFGLVMLLVALFGRVKYQTTSTIVNSAGDLPNTFRIKDIFRGGTDGFIMAKLTFKDQTE